MQKGRYADVLISLYAAKSQKPRIGRLQLQKYIYLCDTISILWDQTALGSGYKTYKRGPYDPKIQNAVDALAFRGLVDIYTLDTSNKNEVSAFYGITKAGIKFIQQIINIPPYKKRYSLSKEVSNEITERGWGNILSLVYAEPYYVQEGSIGWGRTLSMNTLLKNVSIRALAFLSDLSRGGTLSKENITTFFFEMLDYMISKNR